MGKVIGIDLGTTHSYVAVLKDGQPVIISNAEGGRATPSMVGFGRDGDRLIGQLANRQAVTNAENTIFSIKRFIGRRWGETEQERSRVPYNCVRGKDETVDVQIRGKNYTSQEISAMVLQKLKQDAENYLGETVTQAVITVPACFSDAQRQATKDAGTIAGLEVLRIINDLTAAALAYGMDKQDQNQCVLVFDLGGGTFDVSILQLGDGVFEVKATSGNDHLGGDDFDDAIVRWMMDAFKNQEGIDLSIDKMALQRLREAAKIAKMELSWTYIIAINLPFITADEAGPKHLEMELTRAKFEALTSHLVEATVQLIEQALKDAELAIDRIDQILLVGGSTRISAVKEAVGKFFNRTCKHVINPDEAAALGAAIQAGILTGEVNDLLLLDGTALSLGIETLGEVFTPLIARNTTIPTSKTQVFSTAMNGQTSVEIHVLQGERAMAKDNKSLGKFQLMGIPPAPRGVPQIEVVFDTDPNGILKVSARDRGTGREQSISITSTGSLSSAEIERMRQEAEVYADEDKKRKQLVELRNQSEGLVYSYEVTLRDNSELISEDLKTQGAERFTELQAALRDPSITAEAVKLKLDAFQQILLAIGASVYDRSAESEDDSSDLDDEDATVKYNRKFNFDSWNDDNEDDDDDDDDNLTGSVVATPRLWKPDSPPFTDGEAVFPEQAPRSRSSHRDFQNFQYQTICDDPDDGFAGPEFGHFSTWRSRNRDAEILKAALQSLEIPVQTDGDVRGSNGQRHRADIVAVLEGKFDIGYIRAEDGSFDMVVDLWGLAKRYDQTALINAINQQYALLAAAAKALE